MPYDAFISYASADRPLAQDLYDRLRAEGFKVWFDKARLDPGFNWHQEIEQGCENSRVLLPVLTPRWKQSDWTKFETYGAEAVIPLVYDGTWAEVRTPPLERFQAEKLDLASADADQWSRLFAALRRALAEPPPQKSERVDHLRYRANDYFTGREDDLIRIHEELHSNPRTVLTQGRVRAIAAMGGAGKTTLARHYAEKFWRCYPQIFWVDCRIGFEAEFVHIYDTLFSTRPEIGLTDADKAAKALHELSSQDCRLLILDNAEDEKSTMDWIAKTGGCHTLITSRFSGWPPAVIKTMYIYVLDKEPAIRFLLARSNRDAEGPEKDACEILAEKLGYLPLALEQAAAYIYEQGEWFTVADYLRLYDEATQDLLGMGALGSTEYPDSVATTWKPTIAKLPPLARTILRLCAFLADTPISIMTLIAGVETLRQYSESLFGEGLPETVGNPEVLVRGQLARLKAYSMIRLDGQSFSLHPLLQTVELLTQREAERRQAWSQATALLCSYLPPATWQEDCREQWTLKDYRLWGQTLHHIKKLRGHEREITGIPCTPPFLLAAINAYASQDEESAAIPIGRELCDYLDTATDASTDLLCKAKDSLAYLLKQSGLYREGLDAFQDLYQLLVQINGEDDIHALRARHNVACIMKLIGEIPAAEDIMRDVLARRKRVLGEEHYDTITSIHDLGWLLQERKDAFSEAEDLLRHALCYWKQTLDAGNPDIRAAASNLAGLLRKKGDYRQAEAVQRDLLEATQAVLGADHLTCFELKHNLGLFVYHCGRFEEARTIVAEVVDGYRRYLPPDHRDMLTAMQDLGTAMSSLNLWDEAESLLRDALSGYERTQGPDTTDTLRTVHNLSILLSDKGDLSGAEELARRVVETTERTLGPNHGDTIDAVGRLGVMLANQRKDSEAEPILKRSMLANEDALGSENTKTLDAVRNFAIVVERIGRHEEAETLYRRLRDTQERVLGPEHHNTLTTMQNLSDLLDKTGRPDEARILRLQRIQAITAKPDAAPLDLRTAAGDAYRLADYGLADTLLQRVLANGFELPGTHCHLARIALVTGDDAAATEHAAQAWEHRAEAPAYVLPRIIWFQLTARFLTGSGSTRPETEPPNLLGRLKTTLHVEGAHMEWTMTPVLDHLKPLLLPDDYALLDGLVAALNSPDKVAALDDHPAWRAAAPQPLE